MGSFMKGMTFTMEGKEYEVLGEGTADPSSCLVYAPRNEKETADPLTLRMWKAEAKLARGDIMISGYSESREEKDGAYYPPVVDPLEQIAQLKKRIQAIEKRRVSLLKVDDPGGLVLLQDNMVRPNRHFDVWRFARASGDEAKKSRAIQYVKIRGLVLSVSGPGDRSEYFLFSVGDQFQPCCRIVGDSLSSEGKVKLDLTSRLKTARGCPSQLLTTELGGRIELEAELRLECGRSTGAMIVRANILKAAYIRDVNAPSVKMNAIVLPELGERSINIEGVCVDIYTDGPEPL